MCLTTSGKHDWSALQFHQRRGMHDKYDWSIKQPNNRCQLSWGKIWWLGRTNKHEQFPQTFKMCLATRDKYDWPDQQIHGLKGLKSTDMNSRVATGTRHKLMGIVCHGRTLVSPNLVSAHLWQYHQDRVCREGFSLFFRAVNVFSC